MPRYRVAALLAVLLLTPRFASAQTKVAGQWSVQYTKVVIHLHSGDTTMIDQTAQMTLHPRGDSVFGVWQAPAASGEAAPPPHTIHGIIRGDSVRVQVDPSPHDDDGFFSELGREIVEFIKTHVHNLPTTIPLLEFKVRGDSLSGTRRAMTLDGLVMTAPRPLSGARIR